jgi:hypothetical protein
MADYNRPESAILGLPDGVFFLVESYPAAESITPGRPVYQTPGTETSCHATYSAGDIFLGIAINRQYSDGDNVGTYDIYDDVNILKKGRIWAQAAAAVSTAPATVYADSSGLFTTTSGGNYDFNIMARTNQATVSGLLLVEVDAPVAAQ